MKPIVVFYHTTAPHVAHGLTADVYEAVCFRFTKMCDAYNLTTVHCTCDPNERYGQHQWLVRGLDPSEIVYNREICFLNFLKNVATEDEHYIFLEPDINIVKMWPSLRYGYDAALLYRRDATPHISPSWRLCTRAIIPIFEEIVAYMDVHDRKDWHGDSEAFNNLYRNMQAQGSLRHYKNIHIEWREFEEYVKPRNTYIEHFVAEGKRKLLNKEI